MHMDSNSTKKYAGIESDSSEFTHKFAYVKSP